jgi:hypothetical protein
MNAYMKNTERFQINDLILHLKLLEKQKQAKSQISRRKEITKIWAKINERETKKLYNESMKPKVGTSKR